MLLSLLLMLTLRLTLLLMLRCLLTVHLHHVLVEVLLVVQLSEVDMLLLPLGRGRSLCWSRAGLLRVGAVRRFLCLFLLLLRREGYGRVYLNIDSIVSAVVRCFLP